MRRYHLVVTSPSTGGTNNSNSAVATAGKSFILDSQTGSADNTAALDIAFDISVGPLALAYVGSYVEVFGVSIQDVANIHKWQGGTLSLYGGFSAGFPLANPAQYGLLAKGYVLQAFGNWTGTHQSIIFILAPTASDNQVVFHWAVGQKLSQAVTSAIKSSYPGITVVSNLTNDPVATTEDAHLCSSMYGLFSYIKSITYKLGLAKSIGGIQAKVSGVQVILYDSPMKSTVTTFDFDDFQGQPVNFGYGSSSTVQATLNLRADLSIAANFKFPSQVAAGYSITQPASPSPLAKNSSVMKGQFMINFLRHVGRFRDPQGLSWVTVVNGVQA